MPPLQVKDCPQDVYERLRACAGEENRSIAQQALTIIEDFLDMREVLGARAAVRSRWAASYASAEEGAAHPVDYAAKRARAFARIDALEPIPAGARIPSAVDLLAEIREEEAR